MSSLRSLLSLIVWSVGVRGRQGVNIHLKSKGSRKAGQCLTSFEKAEDLRGNFSWEFP